VRSPPDLDDQSPVSWCGAWTGFDSNTAIEFYSECFRNTSEATIVADVEFDIKKANPAAARLLGYAFARDIQGSMKSLLQDERDFARLRQLQNQEAAEFFLRYGSRDAPPLALESLNAITDTALALDCQNQATAEKDKPKGIGGRMRAAAERLRGKQAEEGAEDGAPEKAARPARAKREKSAGRTDTRGKGAKTSSPRKAGGS